MRNVVILLLLTFVAGPVLAEDATKVPAIEQPADAAELKPHEYKRTEARRAEGSYETGELRKILDPFGPAGLVYIMIIVAIMGVAVHVMGQARKVEYARARAAQQDALARAQVAAAKAGADKEVATVS